MPWKTAELIKRFGRPENAAVVEYLVRTHPSAHSDLTEVLAYNSRGVGEHARYCPDVQRYAYFCQYTPNHMIFSLARGAGSLTYRVPAVQVPAAVADGGRVDPDLGGEWVSFDVFRSDEARIASMIWCEAAIRYAATFPPPPTPAPERRKDPAI